MISNLNSAELFLYFSVWILANFYSLYNLFAAQSDILKNNQEFHNDFVDLQPGWNFIPRLKDVSDIEWSSWKYYIQTSWCYLIVQFILSEVIRRNAISHLKHWYIVSSVLFIVLHMGFRQLLIISAQPLLYGFILYSGGNKCSVWLMSLLLLMSYNSLKYKSFFWTFLDRENMYDEEVYLILFCVAWVELRCISFCLDFIEKRKECSNSLNKETVVNMLSYILYVPLLYSGPVILYEDFEKSFFKSNVKLSEKLRPFVCDMSLFLVYTFALDFAFHYIYFHAMQEHMESVKMLPTIALCGSGLWMGLQFHMKYVIAYGTSSAFARLDNMEPPPTPRCIARIHVYSQMWRYFDVGLYRFLVKYIYIPSYHTVSTHCNFPKTANKLIASFATFGFIFMWHGTIKRIFVWTLLNYLGLTLEHLSKAISKCETYKWFSKTVLRSNAMETRFTALLCVPLLFLSAVSSSYLFAGTNVGDLFIQRSMHPSFCNSVLVCASLYCCCQVSMALEDVPSRTDVKRMKVKTE